MPSRLRAARIAFVVASALAAASLLVFAVVMASVTSGEASRDYFSAQRGDDYIVVTAPQSPSDADIQGVWSTSLGSQPPDRVLLVPFEDVRPILAGQAPPHLLAQASNPDFNESFGGFLGVNNGALVVRTVQVRNVLLGAGYSFPFACGTCRTDPRLAIVWERGDAWVGTNFTALARGTWGLDARGHATGDAPILWRGLFVEHNFVDWYETLYGAPFVAAPLAILAGAWWAIEAWLDRRARPPAGEPRVGTEDLLRLVRLSERYLDALWRYQVAGGIAIALGVAALVAFLVPALLAAARRVFIDTFDADVVIVLTPVALGVLAFAIWGVALTRLRAERRRWRALSRELDAAETRILAP